ncbi:MAG: hypothetical protein KGI67_02675 [Pseudomonadota bacterium]|nr:hypothetical protein [Pseudomonadota bacterium]
MLACLCLSACGGGDGTTGTAAGTVTVGGTASGTGTSTGTGANSLATRALPAILASTSTKAINYSAYRTTGGPNVGEVPTDAQISQDLSLLSQAGFTLLRLFDSDPSHANILRVAAASFPNLKFQLGIYLQGIATASQASCSNSANDTDVQEGIALAKQYANVVSVSIGNETSFFAQYMPVHCLASYVTTVKSSISQPVTADDDYTFYAGLDGINELPDTLLPLLDYVSIHSYPPSNYGRWATGLSTSGTAAQRAANLMNGALANAQSTYQQVQTYISAHGGAGLPITVGEIGWKSVPTNPVIASSTGCGGNAVGSGNPLEGNGASCSNGVIGGATPVAATPINAKWFHDLLDGWQAAGTGPKVIFWFEATDEVWKGTDDGWGLWDAARNPRIALCGTPAAPASCPASGDYTGAGYYP